MLTLVLLIIADGIGIAKSPQLITAGALTAGGLIGGIFSMLVLRVMGGLKLGLAIMLAVFLFYAFA